ncbi:hypothetical protein [Roseimaritima sediminicola]|uniref:hypothetical protein n=1 Tax=Roseimaritima sediminicola TaxID=2662066 RepID=UPI001298543D|nr:hypothetical protein [Roseimaritima sediminicola]
MSRPKTIVFTRARWDRIFATATMVASGVAAFCVHLTGGLRFLVVPVVFVGTWLYFRRSTPKSGKRVETIEGNPTTIRLLGWLGLILLWTACFFVFDTFVLGNSFHGPLVWYHWIFLVATVAAMTIGCGLIGPISAHQEPAADNDEPSDAR